MDTSFHEMFLLVSRRAAQVLVKPVLHNKITIIATDNVKHPLFDAPILVAIFVFDYMSNLTGLTSTINMVGASPVGSDFPTILN